MTRGTPSLTPADIERLIARAEADLVGLMLRRAREAGPPPDPSDPADPVRCLEIWIAALRALRAPFPPAADRLLPRKGGPPCRMPRAPPWRACACSSSRTSS
jgi:hypothetical protein